MTTLTIKGLNVQISKEEVQDWLGIEFSAFKSRMKQKKLKALDVQIDPDVLREDIKVWMKRDFRSHPVLHDTYISDFIVKANNGELGSIDGNLKMYFYWIKKLPEGKDLQVKIE